jgi:hypothetical protein
LEECVIDSFVLGFYKFESIRILGIFRNNIVFQKDSLIVDKIFNLKIKIFDLEYYEYINYEIKNCKIINFIKKEFSYIYEVEFENKENDLQKEFEFLRDKNYSLISNRLNLNKILKGKDTFLKNYLEQEKYWYNFSTEFNKDKFVNLIKNIELSFSISNNVMYKKVSNLGINETLYELLNRVNLNDHGIFSKRFSRIYIGNEFCHLSFPSIEILKKILDISLKEKFNVTVCLAPLSETYIKEIHTILNFLNKWAIDNSKNIELVVNDWGLLYLLNCNNYCNIQPVLGILLNKRKKDFNHKYNFWSKKKNAKNLLRYNNLNSKLLQEFLAKNKITRYEFEVHNNYNNIPNGKHSLHFPFFQISTSQYCTLNAICENFDRSKQRFVSNCRKYCDEICFIYPKSFNMVGFGNSIYGFQEDIFTNYKILSYYVNSNKIDRLIYNSII